MALTFAFFNINPGTMIVLAFVGLLLFGRDLPMIARNAARQYYKYKRMFQDATSDIQREMEKAAQVLEDEKRKLEQEVTKDMPDLKELAKPLETASTDSSGTPSETSNDYPYPEATGGESVPSASTPSSTPETTGTPATPAKASADPLALDVPAPSGLSPRGTEPARTTAEKVSCLDSLKSVPPPKKIPPSL